MSITGGGLQFPSKYNIIKKNHPLTAAKGEREEEILGNLHCQDKDFKKPHNARPKTYIFKPKMFYMNMASNA